MNRYKVSLMRCGHAVVDAESAEDAARKALMLSENEIHWLSESEGLPGKYLAVLTELIAEIPETSK